MDKYMRDIGFDAYARLLREPVITPRYRLMALNPDETAKSEIKEDIILGEGSYSEEYANGSRRTLSLSIYDADRKYTDEGTTSSFWWGKKFRFDVGTEYNGDIYWQPKGVFTPSSVEGEGSDKIQISFIDKYGLIDGTVAGKLEMTHKIHRDENIYKTIHATLMQDSGNGYPYDSKPILIDADLKDMALYYTLTLNAGESYGDVFEALREMMNAEIYYNNYGYLVIKNGISDLSFTRHMSQWDFGRGKSDFLEISQSVSYSGKYNQVRVEGAQVDGDLYTCTIENTNPYSSLRVGLSPRVCKVITDNNIVSQKYVNDRALLELLQITLNETDYSLSSSFIPHLEAGKCITVTDPRHKLSGERLLVKSLSFAVDTAPKMSLNAVNIKELPFFENYGYNIIT